MINIIKKSFKILQNNMIFIQPPMLFMLIILTALSYTVGVKAFTIAHYMLALSVFLLTCAFLSGWFYINKEGILNYSDSDDKETVTIKSIQNFKKFFEGVGCNFIRVLVALILITCLYAVSYYCLYKGLKHYIGIPQFIYQLAELQNPTSEKELIQFINTITDSDKISFSAWVLSVVTLNAFLNFGVILFFAVLIFENKFTVFFKFLKFLLKNIFNAIFLILFTGFLYLVWYLLVPILSSGIISFVILILLFTIYLNYYLLLIFCFYYEKSENNSCNGAERDGQNQVGD